MALLHSLVFGEASARIRPLHPPGRTAYGRVRPEMFESLSPSASALVAAAHVLLQVLQ